METIYLSYLMPSLGEYFKSKFTNDEDLRKGICQAIEYILKEECELKIKPSNYMCNKSIEITVTLKDSTKPDISVQ